MSTGLFLRNGDGLTPLEDWPLTSEDELQALIESHPQLLATCFDEDPTSWLLVRREAGVPTSETGGDQFSLDHLLVTSEAIPVLVEVKRASNREIRRQIVGQMLDYAANATRNWPPERLTEWFAATHGAVADERLIECCGGDVDADAFWSQVGTNLRAGKVRLIFVADDIPPELQAIVEFLSAQMRDAQVAAIRIQQFGNDVKSLAVSASRVGVPATAVTDKASSAALSELLSKADAPFKTALGLIEQWGTNRGLKADNTSKARRIVLSCGEGAIYLYPQWASLEVRVGPLRRSDLDERADQIVAMVAALPTGKAAAKFPNVKAAAVAEHWDTVRPVLDAIVDLLDEAYVEIKSKD